MRRSPFVLLCLSLPMAVLAADLFGQLGWAQTAFENACFQFVSEPERLPSFYPTPAMRALAVASRKGAVEAIGARAKAYYGSEGFLKRWAEHHNQAMGGAERERQNAEMREQTLKGLDVGIKQMELMLPMLPPAQQEEMQKAIAKAKAEQAKQASGDLDGAPAKDPKLALRKALQHYLAVTDGIDYAAALSVGEGRRTFTNPAFEAKCSEWKMAFRAGREASEGTRAYVKAWLVELK